MESENEIKTFMNIFYTQLNNSIDKIDDSTLINHLEPNKAAFMRMMIEYINHNYLLYKHAMKEQMEGFITKTELSKNFILNSIDEPILNYTIEDIIQLLEASSIGEQRRNCFSLNENQVRSYKMLFDLEKVFNEFNKENIIPFNKTNMLPIPAQGNANSLKSIEKAKDTNTSNTISLEKTPHFSKHNPNKKYDTKGFSNNNNQKKESKNQIALIYHSPSPAMISKTKKVIEKKNYQTPEKKNYWLY